VGRKAPAQDGQRPLTGSSLTPLTKYDLSLRMLPASPMLGIASKSVRNGIPHSSRARGAAGRAQAGTAGTGRPRGSVTRHRARRLHGPPLEPGRAQAEERDSGSDGVNSTGSSL